MNERDLKLTCEEIKGFLLSYPVANCRNWTMLSLHLSSATFNDSIREKHLRYAICVEAEKIAYFFTSTHFILANMSHIQRILIERFSSAMSIFQNSIAWFLNICFVIFVPLINAMKKRDWWAWFKQYVDFSTLYALIKWHFYFHI